MSNITYILVNYYDSSRLFRFLLIFIFFVVESDLISEKMHFGSNNDNHFENHIFDIGETTNEIDE